MLSCDRSHILALIGVRSCLCSLSALHHYSITTTATLRHHHYHTTNRPGTHHHTATTPPLPQTTNALAHHHSITTPPQHYHYHDYHYYDCHKDNKVYNLLTHHCDLLHDTVWGLLPRLFYIRSSLGGDFLNLGHHSQLTKVERTSFSPFLPLCRLSSLPGSSRRQHCNRLGMGTLHAVYWNTYITL